MDPTEITMINDLGLLNDKYTIKKPHETRQIGMILMDEEGNKIECTVDKSYVILGQALEEYVDVYIHKPTLGLYVDDVMKCYSNHAFSIHIGISYRGYYVSNSITTHD
uniref:DUF223 domain-containing protein n=1 Tax=Lactuca sativa TaxID=4236 RepID=A0A9R1VK04_LACSA|nr:hypothetical protein LSAT_V11C500285010 [Lactuca sativa]